MGIQTQAQLSPVKLMESSMNGFNNINKGDKL